MSRFLQLLALILLLTTGAVVTIGYFAYGPQDVPPDEVVLPELAGTVRVDWHRERLVVIEGATAADRLTGLGFVHGVRHVWPVVLWRQAALGRLSEWLGPDLRLVDAHARRLGLADRAMATYEALPEADRAPLHAYAAGFQAALETRAVGLNPNVALLDLPLEPWEPWHTLAVERLLAWMAASPPQPDTVSVATFEAFVSANEALETLLALGPFRDSIAWARPDEDGTPLLYARHTGGQTAHPWLQEVALRGPDTPPTLAASLLGTPFLVSGTQPTHAWTALLTSRAYYEEIAVDSGGVPLRRERLTFRDGSETLVPLVEVPDAVLLEPVNPLAPDTVWALRWRGLRPGTDLRAWAALAAGATAGGAPFNLLDGHGLVVEAQGARQVQGRPQTLRPGGEVTLVSVSPWAPLVAEQVATAADRPSLAMPDPADTYSPWAARTAPRLLALLDTLATFATPPADPLRDELLTYLRNWNHRYDPASIGATVFDAWAIEHAQRLRLPVHTLADEATRLGLPLDAEAPDSLVAARQAALHALEADLLRAAAALTQQHGSDLRQWRWERVHATSYRFPLWTSPLARTEAVSRLAKARYEAVQVPGRGHVSALYGSSTPARTGSTTPVTWETWLRPGQPAFWVRTRAFTHTADADLLALEAPARRIALDPARRAIRTTWLRPRADTP
ncbi:MAG: penicillin acylase family protein [Bacteroidota bacterium]